MKAKKRLSMTLVIIVGVLIVWNHLPYYYHNDRTVDYVSHHANKGSRSMCTWYVMRAMWRGGCPVGIAPAYAYHKILPQIGFEEVSMKGYVPQKGDISVLPRNSQSPFGHIAVYNGKLWVSDYPQSSIFPGTAYRQSGKYQIYRIEDSWHWKHVWTSPMDWYEWVKALIIGCHKIKF